MQVLTKQRRASGIEDMDILEQEIWNELQRNNWFMDLIMNQRKNQVFVNHVLMVSRVHCHFPRQGGRSHKLLGFVHSDVCGKNETNSLSGAEYFVTFIHDKSRFAWVYKLKHKRKAFEKFTEWRSMVGKPMASK